MKLCFLADARSPIAQNWIRYFIQAGHDVHVLSSYFCDPATLPGASIQTVPVAFSWLASGSVKHESRKKGEREHLVRSVRKTFMPLLSRLRHWLGPPDVYRYVGQIRHAVAKLQPDLVHAMRIPFEGILAAEALTRSSMPLLVSVWGNDFTFHAQGSPLIGYLTQRAMARADALHPDCRRDLNLAQVWGFNEKKLSVVLPGAGGIQTDLFRPGPADQKLAERLRIPAEVPVILNPRGIRGYVRNDTFFQAIPLVLAKRPQAIFLGLAMHGSTVAEKWVKRLHLGGVVRLLPPVSRSEVADLFRLADIAVSPSEHDGTPNTLLEGMACGVFPIAGNIESIQEWIDDGENGFLCDPTSSESLATAIVRAIDDTELRRKAKIRNQQLVAERANYQTVMAQAETFYAKIVRYTRHSHSVLQKVA